MFTFFRETNNERTKEDLLLEMRDILYNSDLSDCEKVKIVLQIVQNELSY